MKIGAIDGEVCLRLDKTSNSAYTIPPCLICFTQWQQVAAKLETDELPKEAYDEWRYKYPELDSKVRRTKVPSQRLSNMLMSELKKR